VLHVQLPAMDLDPAEPVTVVTRVAEVWPTVLGQSSAITEEDRGNGVQAVWTALPWGKEPGDQTSPPPSDAGSGAPTSQPS
jgi:hypothetical protein